MKTTPKPKPPSVTSPQDLPLEVSQAQASKLISLVDDAIEALETTLHDGSESGKLKAAENVLDRAGLPRNTKTTTFSANSSLDLPVDVISGLITGMAKVFGVEAQPLKNVTPTNKLTPASPEVETVKNPEPEKVTPKNIVKAEPEEQPTHNNTDLPLSFLEKHGSAT